MRAHPGQAGPPDPPVEAPALASPGQPWPALPLEHLRRPLSRGPPAVSAAAVPCPRYLASPPAAPRSSPVSPSLARPRP